MSKQRRQLYGERFWEVLGMFVHQQESTMALYECWPIDQIVSSRICAKRLFLVNWNSTKHTIKSDRCLWIIPVCYYRLSLAYPLRVLTAVSPIPLKSSVFEMSFKSLLALFFVATIASAMSVASNLGPCLWGYPPKGSNYQLRLFPKVNCSGHELEFHKTLPRDISKKSKCHNLRSPVTNAKSMIFNVIDPMLKGHLMTLVFFTEHGCKGQHNFYYENFWVEPNLSAVYQDLFKGTPAQSFQVQWVKY
ncbi:hypothetical protein BJ138DRAFT_1098988 [Hygrophoropsis aurantiaca]|uniref:Uncharacterized protein n=1 Tax=Hygrophoropsis aurantiaca TaxID=72124 RepID=A0ACB8AM59_9AGAM|nr:hypothetical protein BJ138DRAFT_1098988 [Hygrophoropsis aurantiaca]